MQFKGALKQIRQFTTERANIAFPDTRLLCSEAGVALVPAKSLPKTALCGTEALVVANQGSCPTKP